MDCSQLVLSVIKDENVKKNLNPIVYYCIKMIYDPEFSKRSRLFCRCITNFFNNISQKLNLKKVISSLSGEEKLNTEFIVNMILNNQNKKNNENENNNNINDENNIDTSLKNNNNNKSNFKNSMDDFFNHDWSWYIETLLDCSDTYFLDSNEDYCLIYLLQEYVFDTQDPFLSELMRGYNLFFSSVELLFSMRLILHFPSIYFMRKEKKFSEPYFNIIKDRVLKFCLCWCEVYPEKYKKNIFIQNLIGNLINYKEETEKTQSIDFIALSLDEPTLTPKYIGLIKLIREGPFLYDLTEIARQLCIIDHKNFSSITQKDYIDYIVKKEIPKAFNKIYKREMHFKCYILMYLLLIKNLENQKKAVQNFIALAHISKTLNNYQTEYTIISTLSAVKIDSKEFLWKMIEKKYKEIYISMEQEYKDVDLNEKTFFDKVRPVSETFVPHIDLIKNQINNFIIQIKMSGEKQKVILCKEYRDFFAKILDYNRNKYSFYIVNPLNEFLEGGFWEICKTKEWGIKSKFDLSQYADENSDVERMFDALVKHVKKNDM